LHIFIQKKSCNFFELTYKKQRPIKNGVKAKHGIIAIDVPPRDAGKIEVVVRGPQKGAIAACAELKELVKRKEAKCNPVTITVDKKQHKFVIGPRGRNIQDVMQKTGVSVEVRLFFRRSNLTE